MSNGLKLILLGMFIANIISVSIGLLQEKYKILKLDRVMFGPLTKKNLPRGKWKFLDQKELRLLINFTK